MGSMPARCKNSSVIFYSTATIKQDWIGQARKLASAPLSSEAQEEFEAPAELVVPPVISQVELAAPAVEVTEPVPPVVASPGAKEAQAIPPVVAITGVLRLRRIEMVPAGTHIPQNCLPYGQPFDVRLTIDPSDLKVPADIQFSYRASIYSKSLEGYSRQVVGETSGVIAFTDKVTVSVAGSALPKGTYRLKAFIILNPVTTEPSQQAGLVSSRESDLLLIF